MSDYHILTQSKDLKTIDVIFHIGINGTQNNEAGIQWRDAVVLEQGGAAKIVSKLSAITSAEDTSLKAGEIVEVRRTVRFSSIKLTNAQRKAEIEAEFKRVSAELTAEKTKTLAFMGLKGMVA